MFVNMPTQPSALAQINERNQQFWFEASELLSRRIVDDALYALALADMSAEEAMLVPLKHRKSLEQALAHAANSKTIVHRALSRKGGKAAGVDALQKTIIEIVRLEPDINNHQLTRKLRTMAEEEHPVILKVDRQSDLLPGEVAQIHFENDGREKTALVSGLKDRLHRARKEIFARTA